jgi:hypothetical protein
MTNDMSGNNFFDVYDWKSRIPQMQVIPDPFLNAWAPQVSESDDPPADKTDSADSANTTYISKETAKEIYDEMGYDFDIDEFEQGMNVETEHNDVTGGDLKKIAMIAAAHLREVPDYYTLLKQYVEK